ncbi:MAG TPA: hypothetical protein VFZ01_09665 [Geminicoccaceae bacterium]
MLHVLKPSQFFPAAIAVGAAIYLSFAAEAQENVQPMTEDMQKAVGAGSIALQATDENGEQITYLRQDVYEEVQSAQTEVQFPLDVTKINAVIPTGSQDEMVIIRYEVNPPKTMQCRWVGSTYTCYTN